MMPSLQHRVQHLLIHALDAAGVLQVHAFDDSRWMHGERIRHGDRSLQRGESGHQFAGEAHDGVGAHLERGLVRAAHAVVVAQLTPRFCGQFANLLARAEDQHDLDAERLQHGDVLQQALRSSAGA